MSEVAKQLQEGAWATTCNCCYDRLYILNPWAKSMEEVYDTSDTCPCCTCYICMVTYVDNQLEPVVLSNEPETTVWLCPGCVVSNSKESLW